MRLELINFTTACHFELSGCLEFVQIVNDITFFTLIYAEFSRSCQISIGSLNGWMLLGN